MSSFPDNPALVPALHAMPHLAGITAAGMDRKTIARLLAAERKARQLTVADLADAWGYSVDHLKKAECGGRLPGFDAMASWAESLGFELVLQKKDGGLS